ncbi:hypothetical protein [Nitrososphaera sp.]|uniref:hypothetical protein n=1 Tax=Nitrososphaera sp. TaxID=1971748 RepID=UPI002ED8C354
MFQQLSQKIQSVVQQSKIDHEKEIVQYCKTRISQLEAIKPILELWAVAGYYAFSPHKRCQSQIEMLKSIIEQLEKEPTEHQRKNVEWLSRSNKIVPFGRDIRSILETGRQVLPEALAMISGFLAEENRRKKLEQAQREHERNKQQKIDRQAKIEDEKRRRREALEAELGISLGGGKSAQPS